jgi:hypothetical protein
MDMISGIAAASQAVGLVKELKEIDPGVDEASFKLKIAELVEILADTKIALSDAKTALSEKDIEIRSLLEKLEEAKNGENCPKCKAGRLQVILTTKHTSAMLARCGVQIWHMACDNRECQHAEEKIHDPNKMMQKT